MKKIFKAGEIIPDATWSIKYYKNVDSSWVDPSSNEQTFLNKYMPTL
jgi:hypothetical protein